MAELDWDVLVRLKPLDLPKAIEALPVCCYERVLQGTTAYSTVSAFDLKKVLTAPKSYWSTSTPVLGYMGSLSLF